MFSRMIPQGRGAGKGGRRPREKGPRFGYHEAATTDPAMDIISVSGLTKAYGELVAVDHVSLAIAKGEIFGLLGPNGAGKTTTLMMLATLLRPDSGTATVNGFDVVREPAKVRGSIGMVFQDPSSDDILTGEENLRLHALMYDLPLASIDGKIDAVLDLVDLKDRKRDLVRHYSGGMRRRLEIARGLLHEPEVLFLDEPTLGLDPQTRAHIWEYVESLAERSGMTIIVTTHYMEEADKLCDRVAIVDRGRVVALDSPANLKRGLGGDVVLLRGDIDVAGLRALPYVRKAEAAAGGQVRLTLEDAATHLPALLVAAGKVRHVEAYPPDLNDVFLHFTGRGIREEEGDAMDAVRNAVRARNGR